MSYRDSIPLRRRSLVVLAVALALAGSGSITRAGSKAKHQAAKATPASTPVDADAAAKRKAEEAALNNALSTTTPVGPFKEVTTATSAAPVDLTGVWLVVVHTRPSQQAPDKYQSFVQLMKITDGATPKPQFHMLDVQLPMQGEIDESMRSLRPWNPTPDQLAALKQSWSALPPYKEKNLNQNILGTVEYTVVTPEHYVDGLPGYPADGLKDSTFAVRVLERYLPGKQPENSPVNIAQVIGRESIYVFNAKGEPPAKLNGQGMVKFTVAGAGFPLPLNFGGEVQMFKVGTPTT